MENEIWVAAGAFIGAALASFAIQWGVGKTRTFETRKIADEIKQHTTSQVKRANGVPWSFIENCPLPTWCKDVNGVMVWINNEYERQWNVRSNMYEGRTDFDVWPSDIAAAFRRHDQLVIAQKRTLLLVEEVPDSVTDPEGPRRQWRIWKFPVVNNSGDVVAVGGIAAIVDLNDLPNAMPIVIEDEAEELWLAEPGNKKDEANK